jgi:hypothetical protein
MTNRAALLQLRDRLVKATGPDRRLDNALAPIAGWMPHSKHDGGFWWCEPGVDPTESYFHNGVHTRAPEFTGSIDDAVTLVPDEYQRHWKAGIEGDDGPVARFGNDVAVAAATPALAICLARVTYELENTSE